MRQAQIHVSRQLQTHKNATIKQKKKKKKGSPLIVGLLRLTACPIALALIAANASTDEAASIGNGRRGGGLLFVHH